MRQLTGLDATFLYLESPNVPMHISGLSIYDQSTAPGGGVRFKEIIDNIHTRMLSIPTMTQHLVTVPMELDHPYWLTDGTFDPEFHIRHIALPKPGDWRQLCILISRLHARPLDRNRPLWELYVIEGLDNVEGVPAGSFAMFSKVHHAAIDGSSREHPQCQGTNQRSRCQGNDGLHQFHSLNVDRRSCPPGQPHGPGKSYAPFLQLRDHQCARATRAHFQYRGKDDCQLWHRASYRRAGTIHRYRQLLRAIYGQFYQLSCDDARPGVLSRVPATKLRRIAGHSSL